MKELIDVDPGTLIIGANVRTDPRLDKEFVDSVQLHGVKDAIQAYWDDAENLVVVDGQCRTLAAVQVGCPLVKVEVIDRPDDAGRIVHQLVSTIRSDFSGGERLRAFEQLSLLGLPASTIAKQTGQKLPTVKAALAVAGSEQAAAAVIEHDVDLVDAAVIAEFADDPEQAGKLVAAARSGTLTWAAQRAREDRDHKRQHDDVVASLTEFGVTVLPQRPEIYKGPIALLTDLANGAKKISALTHKRCPGHAAFVDQHWSGGTYKLGPKYVCTDFKKHGHTATGMRAAAGADPSPEAKAERSEVIAGNRDWKTATTIRHTWLRDFLAGRTAPATAAGFIALSLAADSVVAEARNRSSNAMAHYLLGQVEELKSSGYSDADAFVELVSKATEKRALMITLGIVLGAYEANLMGNEWRSGKSRTATRYLRYLQVLGFELSPIELRTCGETAEPDQPVAG